MKTHTHKNPQYLGTCKLRLQLTFEQQGFELRRSTYTQIFFQVCGRGIVDVKEPQIGKKANYKLYGFSTVWTVGRLTLVLFKDRMYTKKAFLAKTDWQKLKRLIITSVREEKRKHLL